MERSMKSAVREAKLRLKSQRIKIRRSVDRPAPEILAPPRPRRTETGPPRANRRRRGRPITIPNERKRAALECKAKGGSNRDAAVLLYDKKYPTPQEVKNVPSILRHYEKTANKPKTNAMPTSRKANKNKG